MKKIKSVSDYLPLLTSYLQGKLNSTDAKALEAEIKENEQLNEELNCLRHYFELFPSAPPPHVLMKDIWDKMLPNLVGVAEEEEAAPSEAPAIRSAFDTEQHFGETVPPKLLAEGYEAPSSIGYTKVREPINLRSMAMGLILIGCMALASSNNLGGLNTIKAGSTLDDLPGRLFMSSAMVFQSTTKSPITAKHISPYLYFYPPITSKPCSKKVEELKAPNYASIEGQMIIGDTKSEYEHVWNSVDWINNLIILLNSPLKDNPDVSFFSNHGENAFVAGLSSKVPPGLIYFLASQRSKNGQSAAAIQNNNFFNIPKDVPLLRNVKDEMENSTTGDIELNKLKKYATPQDSFNDFAKSLADQPMLKQSIENEIKEVFQETNKLAIGQEKETGDSVKIVLASMLDNLPPMIASRFE